MLEVSYRFSGVVDRNYPTMRFLLMILSFCSQMGCIMTFGLESMKTEPVYGIFKFTRKIGAFIQKKFDTREKKLKRMTKAQVRKSELLGMVLFGTVCFFVGTGVLAVDHMHKRWAEESVNWKVAEGLIVRSEITPAGESGDKADISFIYDVGDKTYTSHSVVLGLDDWATIKEIQQTFLNNYPLGKRVNVYYDPSWPARCTLMPGKYYNSRLSKILLGCCALFGFILVLVGLFNIRRVPPKTFA